MHKLTDVHIADCAIGISMPKHGADTDFTRVTIERCGTGIEYKDAPSLVSALGLPPDTPIDDLIAIIKILKSHEKTDVNQKEALIKRSSLNTIVSQAVNSTTIIANLITISAIPQLAPLLAMLKLK